MSVEISPQIDFDELIREEYSSSGFEYSKKESQENNSESSKESNFAANENTIESQTNDTETGKQLVINTHGGIEGDWSKTWSEVGGKFDSEKGEVRDENGSVTGRIIGSNSQEDGIVIAHLEMVEHFKSNSTEGFVMPDWQERSETGDVIAIHVTVAFLRGETIFYETWSHVVEQKEIEDEIIEKEADQIELFDNGDNVLDAEIAKENEPKLIIDLNGTFLDQLLSTPAIEGVESVGIKTETLEKPNEIENTYTIVVDKVASIPELGKIITTPELKTQDELSTDSNKEIQINNQEIIQNEAYQILSEPNKTVSSEQETEPVSITIMSRKAETGNILTSVVKNEPVQPKTENGKTEIESKRESTPLQNQGEPVIVEVSTEVISAIFSSEENKSEIAVQKSEMTSQGTSKERVIESTKSIESPYVTEPIKIIKSSKNESVTNQPETIVASNLNARNETKKPQVEVKKETKTVDKIAETSSISKTERLSITVKENAKKNKIESSQSIHSAEPVVLHENIVKINELSQTEPTKNDTPNHSIGYESFLRAVGSRQLPNKIANKIESSYQISTSRQSTSIPPKFIDDAKKILPFPVSKFNGVTLKRAA